MQSSGGCGRFVVVVAALVAGAGCGVGGGMLSGTGASSAAAGHGGSHSVIVGTAGAGQPPLSGTGGWNQCGEIPQPTPRLFPAVMIVLDTAASMNDPIDPSCTASCQSKWAASVAGINAVVGPTTADVGWGLSFIGGAVDTCDLGGVGSLIGVDDSFERPLAAMTRSDGGLAVVGNRPTRGAIARAAQLLSLEEQSTPRAILLITDGMPVCRPGDPAAQADDWVGTQTAVLDAQANGTVTSVVGLGISDVLTDNVLSNLALAGGGPVHGLPEAGYPAYFPAWSSGDLISAMKILLASIDCIYPVPAPPTNDGTTSRSDISINLGDQTIFQGATDGWMYTDASHTAIQLLGGACAMGRSGVAVSIIFHCFVG
jgi:hypothetical protein